MSSISVLIWPSEHAPDKNTVTLNTLSPLPSLNTETDSETILRLGNGVRQPFSFSPPGIRSLPGKPFDPVDTERVRASFRNFKWESS